MERSRSCAVLLPSSVAGQSSLLGPEVVERILVEVANNTSVNSPLQYERRTSTWQPGSFLSNGLHRGQGNRVVIIGQNVMELHFQLADGELEESPLKGEDLGGSVIIAGDWTPTGNVHDDTIRQHFTESGRSTSYVERIKSSLGWARSPPI